jgi:H+/Cl- antiporter ClcA
VVVAGRGRRLLATRQYGAILSGAMHVPLTGIVFSHELTHDVNPLLPLLDESLRVVVHRLAENGITRFPVVERKSQNACWNCLAD